MKKNILDFNYLGEINKKFVIIYLRKSLNMMKVPFVVQILRWFNLTVNSAHTFAFSCIKCPLPKMLPWLLVVIHLTGKLFLENIHLFIQGTN